MWQPPNHRLERVEITLVLPDEARRTDVTIRAAGRASTRRADLWTYQETLDAWPDVEKGYGAGDALNHIALVCMQDRPNTLDRLQFALRGGLAWEQGEFGW